MLTQILKEFRQSGGAVNLDELSRRVGVERSALDCMLATLVRQGKLREVCTLGSSCGCHCGGCHGCSQPNRDVTAAKSYELISPAGNAGPESENIYR